MSTTNRKGKSNPLHAILASDRMTRLGYSLEEINAYLRETPFDELVQSNFDALEARFAADEAGDSEEARERRELAEAIMRSSARPSDAESKDDGDDRD